MMHLEDRSVRILEKILESDAISVKDLAKKLSLSKRSVYYSLDDINFWLDKQGLDNLKSVRGKGYFVQNKELVYSSLKITPIMADFTIEERQSLITCTLLMHNEKVLVEDLMNLTLVSRNTIFNDFKEVKKVFQRYNLDLEYVQKKGYKVIGSEIKKRSLFLYAFYDLNNLVENALVPDHLKYNFLNRNQIYYVLANLREIEKKLNVEYVEGTLLSLSALINVVIHGRVKVEPLEMTKDINKDAKEYKLLKKHFSILSEKELDYFSLHLLSTRTQITSSKVNQKKSYALAIKMVENFEQLAAVTFSKRSLLIKQISSHLAISSYRYRYGIHHANPLLKEIKEKYHNEFVITNEVFDIVRNTLKVPVSEGEVAYITLYFASFLVRKNYFDDKVKFNIVCPSGVSTSLMLKSEIEYLDSNIEVEKTMSVKEFNNRKDDNIIISTVNLNTDKDYIKVNPVLNNSDKEKILSKLPNRAKNVQMPKMTEILEIVSPYIVEGKEQLLKKDLENYFSIRIENDLKQDKKVIDVLSKDNITIKESVKDWHQALFLAAQPLIDKEIIQMEYVDAIIDTTNKFGAYMVIDKGYMLAHASYEDGVNEIGLAFLKLNNPVKIKKAFVDKIFVLSPIDQKQHLSIMRELYKVFTSETINKKLNQANTSKEIYLQLLDFLLAE